MDYERKRVDAALLAPSPFNPRIVRDDDPSLDELAADIEAKGQHYPCIVRKHPKRRGKYEIAAGERRWRACLKRKLEVAIEVRDLTDKELIEICVSENLQREQLSPLEEARGIATLLTHGWKAEEVAERFGKSERWVHRRARLNRLTQRWRDLARNDERVSRWSNVMLEEIAALEDATQEALFTRCEWGLAEMTLDVLRSRIAELTRELRKAPWPLDDKRLPGGSCADCDKRTACRAHLFEERPDPGAAGDRCLDSACWEKKQRSWVKRQVKQARKEHGDDAVFVGSGRDAGLDFDHWLAGALDSERTGPWNVTRCKADAPGAKPAVFLDTGKTGYIKPREHNAGAAPKPDPAREAARRQSAFIWDRLAKAWAERAPQATLQRLAAAAAAFGCDPACDDPAFEFATVDGNQEAIRTRLAAGIWDCFENNFRWLVGDRDEVVDPAMECLAGVARIDLAAIRAEALRAHPEPALAADKSPKRKRGSAKRQAVKGGAA